MQVKIISGVSGAGKSSWIKAQAWYDNASVHSADDFFMQDGVYRFDASKLGEAHGSCLRSFIHGCRAGWRYQEAGMMDRVPELPIEVVDNTNLSSEEIAPYYSVAQAYGYEVTLVTLRVPSELAVSRNQHGVDLHTIKNMEKRLSERRIPFFWKLKQETYLWHNNAWLKV